MFHLPTVYSERCRFRYPPPRPVLRHAGEVCTAVGRGAGGDDDEGGGAGGQDHSAGGGRVKAPTVPIKGEEKRQ